MTIGQEKKFEMTIGQELTKSPLQLSGGMSYDSKGLEEDDIESLYVQRVSVAPTQSFVMQHRSADATRCPSFNHTTEQTAPMSHNLTSTRVVDGGDRALLKRQLDVDSSEVEGFKELFQVFSLTAH